MISKCSLIDEGNALLKDRRFDECLQKYEEALSNSDLHENERIRALSNKSQVLYIQKNLEESDLVCDEVLKLNQNHVKSLVRKAKIKFTLGARSHALHIILQIKQIHKEGGTESEMNEQFSKFCTQVKSRMVKVDGSELLRTLCAGFKQIVTTKYQLVRIEDGEYHDKWKLQEHFDATSEEKYITCPVEKFCLEVMGSNNNKLNGVPVIDLYHRFAQGSRYKNGFLNILALTIFQDIISDASRALVLNGTVISAVDVVKVRYRGKSIIFHSINHNGCLCRDFDVSYVIKLSDPSGKFVYVDFMNVLYCLTGEEEVQYFKKLYPLKVSDRLGKEYKVYSSNHSNVSQFVNGWMADNPRSVHTFKWMRKSITDVIKKRSIN